MKKTCISAALAGTILLGGCASYGQGGYGQDGGGLGGGGILGAILGGGGSDTVGGGYMRPLMADLGCIPLHP